MTPTSPAVQRARSLADALLRPAAGQVDRGVVPRSHLDAWGAAGLLGVGGPPAYGGGGAPVAVVREVTEILAGACGATWFVATQHGMPLGTLTGSGNEALKERLLPGLCSGQVLSGVAVAQLRRPGPPAVTATRVDGGWRFDGHVGWMTCWGIGDVVLCPVVAATQAAGHAGSIEDELALLVVHGGLHLVGWDHEEDVDRHAMWARERELMTELHRAPARDPWIDTPVDHTARKA